MLKISTTHPMDEYIALLSKYSKIYIDNERLDRAVSDAQFISDDYRALALLELRIESGGSYQSVSADSLIDFLWDIGVDVDKRCRGRKTQGYSLDMKRVIEPIIAEGIAVEILEAYKTYKSYRTYASFLADLADRKHIYTKTSDGRIILDYDTHIEERENLRVYYSDIAAVSIPKKFSNIVTGPDESWHLAWCDYPQADWRFAYNLFIKDETNVDLMRSCEDAYEGLARLVEGENFDPQEFNNSRKEYKVNCLKVFYNSRDNRPIPTAMRGYFRSRERYRKYVYNLSVLYNFKLPVPCTSYFGHEQYLPEATYPDAFLSKGLNTPIQTFTSHIVNETVFGVLEKFYSLGYTDEDIRIYYVRHDELIFLFRDTILKDAWVFADCSMIHIDGFTPLRLEFHYGDYYQEEDAVLSTRIQQNIDAHSERITKYEMGESHPYYPVPSVESLHVQFFDDESEDGFVAVYYDYRTGKRTCLQSNAESSEAAFWETIEVMLSKLNFPKYLFVRNGPGEFMNAIGPEGDTLLKVTEKYDSGVAVSSAKDAIKP